MLRSKRRIITRTLFLGFLAPVVVGLATFLTQAALHPSVAMTQATVGPLPKMGPHLLFVAVAMVIAGGARRK